MLPVCINDYANIDLPTNMLPHQIYIGIQPSDYGFPFSLEDCYFFNFNL